MDGSSNGSPQETRTHLEFRRRARRSTTEGAGPARGTWHICRRLREVDRGPRRAHTELEDHGVDPAKNAETATQLCGEIAELKAQV